MGSLKLSFALLCTMTFLFKNHICITPNDQKTFLEGHNTARSQVGVAPIAWDNKLEAYAQDIVDKAKSDCILEGRATGPYGMNTAAGYGAFTSWEVIGGWVNEKNNYNYATNSCAQGKNCTHYTQVVWRNSVRLGCAIQPCGAGWPLTVCAYDPAGNVPGQKPY